MGDEPEAGSGRVGGEKSKNLAKNREKPFKIAKNGSGGAFGGVLGLKTAKNRGISGLGRVQLRIWRMARMGSREYEWIAGFHSRHSRDS